MMIKETNGDVILWMGVEDNSGRECSDSRYLVEWMNIRNRYNTRRFRCKFPKFDIFAVTLRIGGKFGDFDGGQGPERRRYNPRSRSIGCDMVIQCDLIRTNTEFFTEEKAREDFLACLEYLFQHKHFTDCPLSLRLLKASFANDGYKIDP